MKKTVVIIVILTICSLLIFPSCARKKVVQSIPSRVPEQSEHASSDTAEDTENESKIPYSEGTKTTMSSPIEEETESETLQTEVESMERSSKETEASQVEATEEIFTLVSNTWIGDDGSFLTLNPDYTGVYWEPNSGRENLRESVQIEWSVEDGKLIIPEVGGDISIYTKDYRADASSLTFVSDFDIWNNETFSACKKTAFESGYDIHKEFIAVETFMKQNDGAGVKNKLDEIENIVGEIDLISDYKKRLELFNNSCWIMYLGNGYATRHQDVIFRLDGTCGEINLYNVEMVYNSIDMNQLYLPYSYHDGILTTHIGDFTWDDNQQCWVHPNTSTNEWDYGATIWPDSYNNYISDYNSPVFQEKLKMSRPEFTDEEKNRVVKFNGYVLLLPESWEGKCDVAIEDDTLFIRYKGFELAEFRKMDVYAMFGGDDPGWIFNQGSYENTLGQALQLTYPSYTYRVLNYSDYSSDYSIDILRELVELQTNQSAEIDNYLDAGYAYTNANGEMDYYDRCFYTNEWFNDLPWNNRENGHVWFDY